MYNQYLILGEAVDGREDEFADWYSWVHIRDVMAPRPAAIAAQCFRRADVQIGERAAPGHPYRFLSLYENSDPVAMTGGGGGEVPPDMLISSSADHAVGMGGGYYDTVIERTKAPGEWPDADLIAEWIERPDPATNDMERYIGTRFPALMSDPDIVSGWVGRASEHQIFPTPRPAYVALYRTTNLENAGRIWKEAALTPSWADDNASVTSFRQTSKRVTRAEVLDPDPATAEMAEAKRRAVKALTR